MKDRTRFKRYEGGDPLAPPVDLAEALDAIAHEMGGAWVEFGRNVDGARAATTTVAQLHALPFDAPFDTFRIPPEQEAKVGSRLGAADRLVTFAGAPCGPFGQPVAQLPLRHHMLARDLPPEAAPEAVKPLPEGRGFTFRLGGTDYRYSRWGVERLPSNAKKESPSNAE